MKRTCALFIYLIFALFAVQAFAKDPGGRYLVVLDPGHGGNEVGVKISGDVYEKDITLAIAGQLKSDLEKAGFAVRLTRTYDTSVGLEDRIKMANDPATDLFLSIHVNAGFGRDAFGYELLFPGFTSASNETNDSGAIVKDMVKNQNLNESVRLARIIQRRMETVLPRKDRGLRDAPLRVQPSIPSLVIEIGFASNPAERKQITSKDVQKKISGVLAASVKEFVSTGKK